MERSTPATASLLSVDGLSVAFGTGAERVAAVRDVSFTVEAGEILGIVGESGSGKSVTCRALLGLLPRYATASGGVAFDGRDLLHLSDDALERIRGREISMIFQNPTSHLDPLMTAGGHVAEPLRIHFGQGRGEARATAIEMLRAVHINDAERCIDAYPHELSGGMKQRVLIAAAIACRPRLLLADEPTTALDVTVQAHILDLLRELNERQGLSIILVSHDLGVIAETCDRVVVMRDGVVVEQGPTSDIIRRPRRDYTRLLVSSQPSVIARTRAPISRQGSAGGDSLLAVDGLCVTFNKRGLWRRGRDSTVRAVDAVSFAVRAGESFGIVGESGSGKSTIARAITRLVSPSDGDLRYRGESIPALRGGRMAAFRRAVQMVFQNPFDSLNPRMTIIDAIAEPIVRHGLAGRRQAQARARALMEQVELDGSLAERRPRQLSGGQCQRVGIARALALDPELLIADEITSALDVTIQAQVLALLERLRKERNLTVLYISHDLAVVRLFCERVAVFQRGHLVEMGETQQVLDRPKVPYTQALIASAPKLEIGRQRGQRAADEPRAMAWPSDAR